MESKEALKVEIEEVPEEKEDDVKQLKFSINTGQSGVAQFITPIINGELVGVIVSTDKNIGVSISLDEMEDICLWKDVDFFGRKYLPLRCQPVHSDGLVLRNEHTEWYLNDRLKMKVKGPFNTTVDFIVRWC
jgi:hypothetical protein